MQRLEDKIELRSEFNNETATYLACLLKLQGFETESLALQIRQQGKVTDDHMRLVDEHADDMKILVDEYGELEKRLKVLEEKIDQLLAE
ncbi:MAG: hypothetical protein AAGE89_11255 [Pseudomonadota bacterium]